MLTRLLYLLILMIFVGINAQQPTDAAKKINNILNKMEVTNTTSPTGCYTEVSPDAQYVHAYDANHESTSSQPISARIREILNKKDATEAEQEEATFFCYRLGTKFQNTAKTECALRKKSIILKSIFFGTLFPVSILLWVMVNSGVAKIMKEDNEPRFFVSAFLTSTPAYASYKLFNNWLNSYCKKQDKKELDRKTFYNLGRHTAAAYSHLLKKIESPACKKAFEEGRREARKIITAGN